MVGCGAAAAYPVPGTTRWYVYGSTPPYFSLRTPPGSRTPHPLIKSQVLWPDELEAHIRLPAMDLMSLRTSGTCADFLTEGWHKSQAHGGARRTVHTIAGSNVNRLVWLTGQMLSREPGRRGGRFTDPGSWTVHHTILSSQSSSRRTP